MIQPHELKLHLPVKVALGMESDTGALWELIQASFNGDLDQVKSLVNSCPGLIYAQYNYTPPIHFAVREGHVALVNYLLGEGALDPSYKTYPFLDSLLTMAEERGYAEIVGMLKSYLADTQVVKISGDNGEINYLRNAIQQEFEQAVDQHQYETVKEILEKKPQFALDETYFWNEGILMMPAKDGDIEMLDLLMSYGATVPVISKWGQFYYFKKNEIASYLLEHGMDPNHHSWQGVSLLHDMAQKGDLQKADLLIKYGANLNTIDDEYQSTPLGIAARWGQDAMVELLLDHGADPRLSGATWSIPLAWARAKHLQAIEKMLEKKIAK